MGDYLKNNNDEVIGALFHFEKMQFRCLFRKRKQQGHHLCCSDNVSKFAVTLLLERPTESWKYLSTHTPFEQSFLLRGFKNCRTVVNQSSGSVCLLVVKELNWQRYFMVVSIIEYYVRNYIYLSSLWNKFTRMPLGFIASFVSLHLR